MKLKKTFLIAVLLLAFSVIAFYVYLRPKYVVPVLMYHHISKGGETSSLCVSPENFRRQMQFLSGRNYNIISLAEFVQAKAEKDKLARNTVVLTFDDGYEDNYTFAYPVLKEYNLPATMFVIVTSIGKQGYLDYQQIRDMVSSEIITIGSHTLKGDYLPGQSSRDLEREIGLSKRILETRLNEEISFFCYPIGGFSAKIQEIVQKYGYQAACTTNRGRDQSYLNNDLFALKRIKVKDSPANLFVFWVKLSGHYNFFRRVRKPY